MPPHIASAARAADVPIANYIGGGWVPSGSADSLPLTNPATGESLGRVPLSGTREVDGAVQAALAAFPKWRATPPVVRARYLFAFKALLESHFDELAGIVTQENGKTLDEARGSVRELDCGRRMMHHAARRGTLPKGFDDRLVTTRDARLTHPTEKELREMQSRLTDRNFRIETDGEAVYVFNSERFVKNTNIRDIFPRLGVEDDASHAFYLGRELMKADLARRLGKKYIQGEPLHWGYLTWSEEEDGGHARARRRPGGSRREPAGRGTAGRS